MQTMTERTLWAVRKGDEDWQEEVITSTTDAVHFLKARKWAMDNGFDRLRESAFDGSKPDFIKAIRH